MNDWVVVERWILAVVSCLGASGGSLFWVTRRGRLRASNMVGAKRWDK
jgi:hypothetical protein